MRFDAFKKEYEHITKLDLKLGEVSLRRYVLDRLEDDFSAFEIYVNVNVVPYPERPTIHLGVHHTRQSGQFQDLGSLSVVHLRRIVEIRQTIDEWIAGVIDELPKSMVWETQLLQLPKL